MPAALIQQPKHWRIPSRKPLNTRPNATTQGALYKVLFSSPMGNPRHITANQNSTGMALFATPWTDALVFETDSLGYSDYVAGQKYLDRRLPMRHGDPAQQSLYLDSLETISFHNFEKTWHEACTSTDGPASAGWPKTEMLAYRALFSQRSYPLLENSAVQSSPVPELKRFITKFPESEGFHVKQPGHGWRFASGGDTEYGILGSLPEFMQRWTYITHFWPFNLFPGGQQAVPLGYIARTLGTVNDAVFDPDLVLETSSGSMMNGFPAEELKLEDCRLSQPYYGSDDKLYVDVAFIFLWNHRNWNKKLRPSTGEYEYLQQVDKNNDFYSPVRLPYIKRNFNRLFLPRGVVP